MDRHARPRPGGAGFNGLNAVRTSVIGLSRVLFMGISASAAPLLHTQEKGHHRDEGDNTPTWLLLVVAMVLVLAGGVFAGLTIALMGQDAIYLQVIAKDHTEPQHKNAKRVFDLLKKGKHWVLVTLLLSNVIVNETLPVILDRALGGGAAAIFGSTVLIVIFGEVIPQSLCVRYGLQIGGFMATPVLLMMWLMSPAAWPTAKLLDWLLGEDHGTVYRKSGLKTLVTLHRSLGEVSERLNQDEVTIISAVLDLKEKPVRNVMTPMDDVFTMSEDTVLDEKMMDLILSAGYSRIPIHEPGRPTNFIGMLLVKILITYDPEDGQRVRDFPLATLPETRPETSCLDIVNFFQEGKSHMVLVSEYPGEDHGAIGVVTLEDVIEELIGEEIIDESDVYIDVHKAIRRLQPAPSARSRRRLSQDRRHSTASDMVKVQSEGTNGADEHLNGGEASKADPATLSSSPKTTMFMMRRDSAGLGGEMVRSTVPVRAGIDQMRGQLRHLGPSNKASQPKSTKSTTVKIKPGVVVASTPSNQSQGLGHSPSPSPLQAAESTSREHLEHLEQIPQEEGDDETTSLLRPKFPTGKDGVQALRQSYGSTVISPEPAAQAGPDIKVENLVDLENTEDASTQTTTKAGNPHQTGEQPVPQTNKPKSTAGSTKSDESNEPRRVLRHSVRSGSITENIVESGGIRKVVLETTTSSDDDGAGSPAPRSPLRATQTGRASGAVSDVEEDGEEHDDEHGEGSTAAGGSSSAAGQENQQQSSSGSKKKNRRKKRKGGKP